MTLMEPCRHLGFTQHHLFGLKPVLLLLLGIPLLERSLERIDGSDYNRVRMAEYKIFICTIAH